MQGIIKKTEGRRNFYLVPVRNLVSEENIVVVDASDSIRDAIKCDRERGYGSTSGPNIGQEVQKATDYAEFLNQLNIDMEDCFRFRTSQYGVFSVKKEDLPNLTG